MQFAKKTPIEKGWIGDKKFCAVSPNGHKYYLLVSEATKRTFLPYVRADLMEEFAHWTLTGGFFPLEYMLWYGMNSEEQPLDIPEDYSNTSKAVCIYIKK